MSSVASSSHLYFNPRASGEARLQNGTILRCYFRAVSRNLYTFLTKQRTYFKIGKWFLLDFLPIIRANLPRKLWVLAVRYTSRQSSGS